MLDLGVVSTAIATVMGAVLTGLGTWATMRNKERDNLDTHEQSFIERLLSETKDLRERMDRMQITIDTLMDERRELKNQITDLEIKVRRQEHTIDTLTGNTNDSTRTSK